MRRTFGLFSIAAFVLGVQVAAAQDASQSQSQSQSQTQTSAKPSSSKPQSQKVSVADAARKAREEQKNVPKAPAPVVFTNDNIGATAASGTVNVVGNASPAPKSSDSSSTEVTAAGAPGAASASSANDEASWRQRFADARNKLKQDQDDLAVMQRELANLRLQYYPDPQKAMKQSVSNEDVFKKQQAIDKKQKDIQADQQALSGLEGELRKAGGDPSWARE